MDLLEKRNVTINGKEFTVTTKYKDSTYGDIIKAVSTKIENFERRYFMKKDGVYQVISDPKVIEYIEENYENIEDDIII